MKIKTIFAVLFLSITISLFAVKGNRNTLTNNMSFLDSYETSPFESSHSSSRYALVKSIVDDNSIFLRHDLAALASPDLTKVGEHYISIFTPGIALLSIPAYYLGKMIGYPQITTFSLITLISLLNIYLIMRLARVMGANKNHGLFAGLLFAFATNALPYSGTLTQHSVSIAIGTLLLTLSVATITTWRAISFGLLYGFGVMCDIPNAILFLPQLLYFSLRFFSITRNKIDLRAKELKLNLQLLGLIIGLLIPFLFFGYYNFIATGSPLKLGQRLGRAIYPPESNTSLIHIIPSIPSVAKTKFKQFDTERQIRGYYTLIFSDTRGIFYYSPILLLGLLGIFVTWKNKKYQPIHTLALSTIALNLILYATFNDPWGGWSFGPRYLIPTSSLLAIFAAIYISNIRLRLVGILLCLLFLIPSAYITASGALTTTVVPPDVYTESLVERVPDDYQYNLDMIRIGKSGSLPYNLWLNNYISLNQLHQLLSLTIIVLVMLPLLIQAKDRNDT